MAILCELNEDAWEEWLAERPAAVQKTARGYPPNLLYRMESTGQRVMIVSYGEGDDGECTECRVRVLPSQNPGVIIGWEVYGVELADLRESEPLPEEEQWETSMTIEHVDSLDELKDSLRRWQGE